MAERAADTGAPPPPPPGAVRVAFLGGLGEIGRNCAVVELDGARLLIDCGLAFPDADQPGVDIILPDFAWLAEEPERVVGVVLTHAHEDHMGALPYFLRDFDVPVYGTRLSLSMLAAKLEEHELAPSLVEVAPGERTSLGPFDLELFAVSHSIPDGVALALRTPAGTIVHTGDFKMDLTPIDGRPTDLGGLARLAADGIDLLLSDSTNADQPGFIPSEVEVGRALEDIFGAAKRRIVVACFASHVHRVQQILDAAARLGRQVALVGRSMIRNMRVASDLGYLRTPPGLLVPVEDLNGLDPASTLPVWASMVTTMWTKPSPPSLRRSRRTASPTSPTPSPSTNTIPALTSPTWLATPPASSTTSPSSHSRIRSLGTPAASARRACWARWRYSPWTGRKLCGRRVVSSRVSSPWAAWPETCTRALPLW